MGAVRQQSVRSIFLNAGRRIPGLKRDPSVAFIAQSGHAYGPSSENLDPLKSFLLNKYPLLDEMIMQVMTHKSFGNGIKPYNEKLAVMGSKLINLFCAKMVIEAPSTNELTINNKNLDVLGTPISVELTKRALYGLFAKMHKLTDTMFWKSYGTDVGFESSGEMKVAAQMMFALIGAVTFVHGKTAAEQFIKDQIMGAEPGLEKIASQILERGD